MLFFGFIRAGALHFFFCLKLLVLFIGRARRITEISGLRVLLLTDGGAPQLDTGWRGTLAPGTGRY